jgi:hypothetical protein
MGNRNSENKITAYVLCSKERKKQIMENSLDYKEIEIKDRRWRIKKFDAFTGSFMLFKVIGIITPLLKGLDMAALVKSQGQVDSDSKSGLNLLKEINFTEMLSGLTTLPEKEFTDIQIKCLQVCYETTTQGAGEVKVLDRQNNFGVIGLENDTTTVLALTVHSLIFNVTSFFGENPLTGLMGGMLNTSK